MNCYHLPTGIICADLNNNRDVERIIDTFIPEEIARDLKRIYTENDEELVNAINEISEQLFYIENYLDNMMDDCYNKEKKMTRKTVKEFCMFLHDEISKIDTNFVYVKE